MAKKRFKLSFRSTEVDGPGGAMQRALIIAVSPSPVKGWLQAMLACEDGSMQTKLISQIEFDASERRITAMIEIEEEARPVLYSVQAG